MSYARFGPDSDVYVYASGSVTGDDRIVCCACHLIGGGYSTLWPMAMVEHLRSHVAAGHRVPADAIAALDAEHSLVTLDTGELALVTLRRAEGATAPHHVRRWSERLGRLLTEEGMGAARFRGAPRDDDARVVALKGWIDNARP